VIVSSLEDSEETAAVLAARLPDHSADLGVIFGQQQATPVFMVVVEASGDAYDVHPFRGQALLYLVEE